MRIIVASDSPINIHKINQLLVGHDVVIIETGEEIFKLLAENKYDCLITEFILNDIDAWHLSLFIKNNINNIEGAKLPVFVINDESEVYPTLLKFNYELQTIDLSLLLNIEELVNNYKIDKPTILIIEDDNHIAGAMSLTLTDNYTVDICKDKEEGLECWKNKKHDLILLDLMLPGGSGEDVLSEIIRINQKQDVVIVSARTEIELQEKYILLGVSDYLTKPFKPNDLNQICRVVLTKAILRHEIDRRENILKSIAGTILDVVDALEKDEIEYAIENLNKVISSINYKKGEDYSLKHMLLST